MNLSAIDDKQYKPGAAYKIIAVIVGAFLMGALWRVRGDHGFGSMWGMFTVAAGFSLFVFSIFGYRKKINFELLPVTILLTAITVGGWGTLNSQISGFLTSAAAFTGETSARAVEINPLSGVFIMLCLGFGWMPFFAFMSGRFFSGRKYSFRDFLLAIVIFYAIQYICKATVSHLILNLVNPQAVSLFGDGLADRGLDTNQFLAYLRHFNSDVWAKKIPGGRNYFTSVEVISCALGAIGVWIYQRFVLRDKTGGRICLSVSLIDALGITLADIFLVLEEKDGILGFLNAPEWLTSYGWSYWEFFTGFLIGLGVMILFVSIPAQKLSESDGVEDGFPKLKGKLSFAYNSVFTLFAAIGVTLARPAGIRLADQEYTACGTRIFNDLAEFNAALSQGTDASKIAYLEGGLIPEYFAIAALCIIFLIISIAAARKNLIVRRLDTPVNASFIQFCTVAFPSYFGCVAVLYFFVGSAHVLNPVWTPITWLMVISAVIVFAGYFVMCMIRKHKQIKL